MAKTRKEEMVIDDVRVEIVRADAEYAGRDRVVIAETSQGQGCALLSNGELYLTFGSPSVAGRVLRDAEDEEIEAFMPQYNSTL